MNQRNCKNCNTNFLSRHKTTKFCSNACRQTAYRKRMKKKYPAPSLKQSYAQKVLFVSRSGNPECWNCGELLGGRKEKFCNDKCRMKFNRRERQADGVLQLSPLMRRRLRDVIFQQHQPNRKRAQMAYPGFKRITRDKWDSITKGRAHSLATAELSELADSFTGVLNALGLIAESEF